MSDLVVTIKPGAVGAYDAIARVRALIERGESAALISEQANPAAVDGPTPELPSIILSTSGSTGEGRGVELDIDALRASATLAEERLGGPGMWLTAIPVTSAGGLNTVVRSVLNGFDPLIWPGIAGAAHFDGDSLIPSLRALRNRAEAEGLQSYTSLVPTQMARLVSFAAASDLGAIEALRELAEIDAVLVGADALSDELRQTLHAYEIHVVTTYGATETCGGCIYDDRPFAGTTVEFVGDEPGRIAISGPTVAKRYRDGGPELADRRWLSNDLGRWRLGRLELVGRLDDLIKVGGSMVALPLIARQLQALAGIREIAVLARDDAEWGHVPVVFVAGCEAPDATLRQFAAAALGRGSVPMDIIRVETLPMLANGKVDRLALLALVQ
jgi:O-succinylbenzoic acid--CoA ligase